MTAWEVRPEGWIGIWLGCGRAVAEHLVLCVRREAVNVGLPRSRAQQGADKGGCKVGVERLPVRTLWKCICFERLPAVKNANSAVRSFLLRACQSASVASPRA